MNSPLPPTGTAQLLTLLDPYVPDVFINEHWGQRPKRGPHRSLSAAQLWRLHLLAVLTPSHSFNQLVALLPEQRGWREFARLANRHGVPGVRMLHEFRSLVVKTEVRRDPVMPSSRSRIFSQVGTSLRLLYYEGREAISRLTPLSNGQNQVAEKVIKIHNNLHICQLLLPLKLHCYFNLVKIPRVSGVGRPLVIADVKAAGRCIAQKHFHWSLSIVLSYASDRDGPSSFFQNGSVTSWSA